MVDAIAATIGRNCEVVLHDFSIPDHSIIKIANGHVTNRQVGGPATDLVLPFLEDNTKAPEAICGYRNRTSQGTELKSTTVFIRNTKGKIIGALCINIDITPFMFAKTVIDDFAMASPVDTGNGNPVTAERYEMNVDSLINDLLEKSINRIGKPVVHMNREDKLNVVRDLKQKGFFLIKASAKKLARRLSVSLPTVYKYLEEI
jgi:predicted transcriptional regulator YheO